MLVKSMSVERDIFSRCNIGLLHYKIFMLELIQKAIMQQEGYKPMTISLRLPKSVNGCVRCQDLEWIDWKEPSKRFMGERSFSFKLQLHKAASLKVKIKEVTIFLRQSKNLLKKTEENWGKWSKMALSCPQMIRSKSYRICASMLIFLLPRCWYFYCLTFFFFDL